LAQGNGGTETKRFEKDQKGVPFFKGRHRKTDGREYTRKVKGGVERGPKRQVYKSGHCEKKKKRKRHVKRMSGENENRESGLRRTKKKRGDSFEQR